MIYGRRTDADEIADIILEERGEPARYHPSGGEPFDLVVSFTPGGGSTATALEEALADTSPQAAGTRFALAAAMSEDQIEVAGARWIVGSAVPDGGGWVFLTLKGPLPA